MFGEEKREREKKNVYHSFRLFSIIIWNFRESIKVRSVSPEIRIRHPIKCFDRFEMRFRRMS